MLHKKLSKNPFACFSFTGFAVALRKTKKKLHLKIEMAPVNISMSYLVIAAMTKKGSHTVSVMHVALSLFLDLIILLCQIFIEMSCLDVIFYLFIHLYSFLKMHCFTPTLNKMKFNLCVLSVIILHENMYKY